MAKMLVCRDSCVSFLRSLEVHPLRSALTILGVVITNTSFIALASLGESAKIYTVNLLEDFHGPNRLIVYSSNSQAVRNVSTTALNLSDAQALFQASAIKAVAPVVSDTFFARRRDRTLQTWITGTTSDYPIVKNDAIARGRFLSSSEVKNSARVAVLGSNMPSAFFLGIDPIGQTIQIKNSSFRVIGVMKPKGALDKGSPDDAIFIPLSAFSVFLRGGPADTILDYIEIGAKSKQHVNSAIFQAGNILYSRRSARDFVVAPAIPQQILIAQVSSGFTIFLFIMTTVSFLIGGVGIMNVMLITVGERTSEIGLRKAVGAKSASILVDFAIESILYSSLGGAIGTLLGIIVVGIAAIVTPLPFALPLWSVMTSLSASTLVGLAAGIAPAHYASRLDPVVALNR